MHGRPRDYKDKLKDPKAAEAYARKARFHAACSLPMAFSVHFLVSYGDAAVAVLLHLQVAAIKQGTALVLQCRQARRYDPAALTASEKLLKVVPEVCNAATRWPIHRAACTPVTCGSRLSLN